MNARTALLFGALSLFVARPCVARDLVVNGCDGSPLAMAALQEHEQRRVVVFVPDSSSDVPVLARLTQEQRAPLDRRVKNGEAVFDAVDDGEWRLCLTPSGVTVARVVIEGSFSQRLIGTAAVGIAAAAGIAVAVANSGADGSGDTAVSGAGQSGGGLPGGDTPIVSGSAGGSAGGSAVSEHPCLATQESNPCMIGVKPVPTNILSIYE